MGRGRLGSGQEPQDGAVECFPCSTEGGVTHPILKNINWPHDKILMRGKAGLGNLNRELGLGLSEGSWNLGEPRPLEFASPEILGGGGGQSLSL